MKEKYNSFKNQIELIAKECSELSQKDGQMIESVQGQSIEI
jgi:hypothetical protein